VRGRALAVSLVRAVRDEPAVPRLPGVRRVAMPCDGGKNDARSWNERSGS
jgi:hypothetical protein